MHDLAVNDYGRRRVDTEPLYHFGVLNLGNLNCDTQESWASPFDHADRDATLAATRSQDFNFHIYGLALDIRRKRTC